MGRRDDVLGIDEGAAAGVDRLLGVLLQDGHVPGILAELTVSIDVDGILDAASDAGGIPYSAATQLLLLGRSLRTQGSTAADLVDTTGLLHGTVAIVSALKISRWKGVSKLARYYEEEIDVKAVHDLP